jgi:hypothetical protein
MESELGPMWCRPRPGPSRRFSSHPRSHRHGRHYPNHPRCKLNGETSSLRVGLRLRGTSYPALEVRHDTLRFRPRNSLCSSRCNPDFRMRLQSPTSVGESKPRDRRRSELFEWPGSVHGHRHLQQAAVPQPTHQQRRVVVRRPERWPVRWQHHPGRDGRPKRRGSLWTCSL